MLRLRCTLPSLATICLYKSTTAKFYPSTENDKGLLEKRWENMVGGPSIVFTRIAVVEKTFIADSTNWCRTFVGIVASQLYPLSMCQATLTGLCTRWDLDSGFDEHARHQSKTRSFENIIMSYFQQVRLQCKMESFYTRGTLKKIDAHSADRFCGHCNTVFEAIRCSYSYCPSQEARPSLTEEGNQRGIKMRPLDDLGEQYIQEEDHNVIEIYNCGWQRMYKTDVSVNSSCTKRFRKKGLSKKKDFWKMSNLEVYLVMFIVILKFPRISENFLPTFLPSSRMVILVEITLVPLQKNMPRTKDF